MRTERDLQAFIIASCKKRGILCYKFSSPARRGVPDLILAYRGRVTFVEVKSPTGRGRLSTLQEREIQRLNEARFFVWVVDSVEVVERLLSEVITGTS